MLPSLEELLVWPEGQKPYAKQEECHQLSADKRLFACLLEQRTGKTVITLGTIAHQFSRFLAAGGFGGAPAPVSGGGSPPPDLLPRAPAGVDALPKLRAFSRISDLPKKPTKPGMIYRPDAWANLGLDALLVIAMPSGVPGNWANEAKLRLPPWTRARILLWNSGKAGQVGFAEDFRKLLGHEGLSVLLINGEAIPTATAKKAIGTFLRTRRALVVGDETSLICSQPGNVRSRVMDAIRKLPGAVARRILDGTPADESPLDMFSQVGFLDPKILGFESWVAFKKYYACWEVQEIYVKGGEKREVAKIAQDERGRKVYAHLDEMARLLAPVSFRVKRTDCFDIPEKIYQSYRFELSAAQRRVYDPLREEYEAELRDGTIVSAAHHLARRTRLDQVSANYWPPIKLPAICESCGGDGCEACGDVGAIMVATAKKVVDPDRNPRLEAFEEVLSLSRGDPMIAWARFDETIDAILAIGERLGLSPVRYDGKVDEDEKAEALAAFREGRSGLFASKEASGGRGLNLSAARGMIYVESLYSRRQRSQSEDRAEVAGRTFGTGIWDLIAEDTYDDEKLAYRTMKGEVSGAFWGFLKEAKE